MGEIILDKKKSEGLELVVIFLVLIVSLTVFITLIVHDSRTRNQEYTSYVSQNIPLTTEVIDKVILNSNNTKLYIAILNASPTHYEKVSIEDNILQPYISYKKIPLELRREYGIQTVVGSSEGDFVN